MPVVEEYWAGVVQRLQAEVDVFARLIRHYPTQGQENEAALARLLRAFVPRRFGVGTGMVIDRHDHYSRQTDIVLFEQTDEPAILAQTTQLLHPIEGVRACIEVKTRLRADGADDCRLKKKALYELETATPNPDGSRLPLFIVLAYDSQLPPAAVHKKFAAAPPQDRPDLYCILEPGIIGGRKHLLREMKGDYASGIALLRTPAANGRRIGPPQAVPENELDDSMLIEGRPYPVVSVGRDRFFGDPPRALLLFVEALARALSKQQGRPDRRSVR